MVFVDIFTVCVVALSCVLIWISRCCCNNGNIVSVGNTSQVCVVNGITQVRVNGISMGTLGRVCDLKIVLVDPDTGEEIIRSGGGGVYKGNVTVDISGGCKGDASTTIGDLTISSGDVGGGAKSMSGSVKVGGYVVGDVKSQSGNVNVSGDVSGNVKTLSGDVTIRGDLKGSAKSMSGNVR